MVKYTGEFVCTDVLNSRRFLASLDFGWDIGDDLSMWTMLGTEPTISSDGWIDIFDDTPVWGGSGLYYTFPNTIGALWFVLKYRLKRMPDEVNSYPMFQVAASTVPGMGVAHAWCAYISRMYYINNSGQGPWLDIGFNPVAGTEYEVVFILSPEGFTMLVDGVRQGFISHSRGTELPADLSNMPLTELARDNKTLTFGAEQSSGVAHWRIRDVRFGRLVGVSW